MNETNSGRAEDVAAKQQQATAMLRDVDREGLLLLDPASFAWFTGGATAKGVLNPADLPAVYAQNSQRWLICSNVDMQRLFDEELDGLGFQLKEWPWHRGRSQLLADICHGKRVACDVPFGDCKTVGDELRTMRRKLSPWEQNRLREIGKALAHAIEATCRNLESGESEEEVAGQLSHRLAHHGLEPVAIHVAADGRMRKYRRPGITAAKIERNCVIQATIRKWGLHAAASRAVTFDPADDEFRKEMDAACRLTAVEAAGSAAGANPAQGLEVGRQVIQPLGFEHEWRLAPAGWVTGYVPVDLSFSPDESPGALQEGWALVWPGQVGAAVCCDTILVTEAGPQVVTPAELWPIKHIRVAGVVIERPDVLIR